MQLYKCPDCPKTFGTRKGAEIHNGMVHTSVLAKERDTPVVNNSAHTQGGRRKA